MKLEKRKIEKIAIEVNVQLNKTLAESARFLLPASNVAN